MRIGRVGEAVAVRVGVARVAQPVAVEVLLAGVAHAGAVVVAFDDAVTVQIGQQQGGDVGRAGRRG